MTLAAIVLIASAPASPPAPPRIPKLPPFIFVLPAEPRRDAPSGPAKPTVH